ncbi:thiol-disulfide oxidoreductase LTO1 [Telopea speciosissima]|uniref:thiol-disulfide oxidoreductase LTO1 n=1 Tax=Telopea speciosissima TaxID=54955 RepID=UPI001CC5E700|nr:thiol-disulfide oxidoreductase LTO1 [Telopea speciosissima]
MMAVMASFVSISAPPVIYRNRNRCRSPHHGITHTIQFKGAAVILPVKCSGPTENADSEAEESYRPSWSLSAYKWYAGLGALGFIETGYLTYLKFTNSDAFCPVSGGSCSDILNSDYSYVFGVPLPLIGMVAYGLVASVGLHLSGKSLLSGLGETDGRLILLGSSTSMAAASAYFLYLLSTKFAGASCSYCLMSAVLSFSLFFLTLKEFGLQEIQKMVGLQLVIASAVIAALSTSYSTQATQTVSTRSAEIDLQPFTIEIKTESSPLAISLAKHLHSIGAKMYGAFWCSHCLEQKEMFGREAAKMLDYVECFPGGYRRGTKIDKACADAGIEGFPTWVINGQVLSGEQEFSELAASSGFVLKDFNPS